MNWYSLYYILQETFLTFRHRKLISVITLGIMTASFIILTFFLLLSINILNVASQWRQKMEIVILIENNLDEIELEELENKIKTLENIENINFVSKDEALERLREKSAEAREILEVLEINPLPASYELTISPEAQNPIAIALISQKIETFEGIDEVLYGEEWIIKLEYTIKRILIVNLGFGLIIFLTLIFIIASTIKLTIAQRSDAIEIMRLVGATHNFINIPFLLEGALQGIAGSTLALSIVYIAYRNLTHYISDLIFLPKLYIIGLLLIGLLLGLGGSIIALQKYT